MVLAINRWLTAKTKRKYTGVVMVDMSKAFDRVKHSSLIADLFCLGISGLALQWFCSYLSERFQQIKIGDNLSSSNDCSRVVSQCSVYGPYCSIYIYIYIYIYINCQFSDCKKCSMSHKKRQSWFTPHIKMGQFENISYNSEFHAQKQSSGNWILKKLKKDRLLNTIWLEASGSM